MIFYKVFKTSMKTLFPARFYPLRGRFPGFKLLYKFLYKSLYKNLPFSSIFSVSPA